VAAPSSSPQLQNRVERQGIQSVEMALGARYARYGAWSACVILADDNCRLLKVINPY